MTRARITAGVFVLVAAGIYAVFVHTAIGQRFDDAAKSFTLTHHLARTLRQQGLPVLTTLSTIGVGAALAVVVVAVAAWHPQRMGPAIRTVTALMVPTVVAAEALKRWLPRPELYPVPDRLLHATLPSGHVVVVTAAWCSVLFLAPSMRRTTVLSVGAAATFTETLLVVAGGRHRPSDALCAVFFVGAWALFIGRPPEAGLQGPTIPRGTNVLLAAVGLVGLALAAFVAPQHLADAFDADAALIATSVLALSAVGTVTLALVRDPLR